MTTEYVQRLVEAFPAISAVWLIGSRAEGKERPGSDWDYLAFADQPTFDALRARKDLAHPVIDLLVVVDDDRFVQPWSEGGRLKSGSLSGWEWSRTSETSASYRGTKARPGDDFCVEVSVKPAYRVWPSP